MPVPILGAWLYAAVLAFALWRLIGTMAGQMGDPISAFGMHYLGNLVLIGGLLRLVAFRHRRAAATVMLALAMPLQLGRALFLTTGSRPAQIFDALVLVVAVVGSLGYGPALEALLVGPRPQPRPVAASKGVLRAAGSAS